VRGVLGGFVPGTRPGFRTFDRPRLAISGLFYGDPYFLADYPATSYAAVPGPQVIVVQAATPVPSPPPDVKPEPLLIEANDSGYVKIDGEAAKIDGSPSDHIPNISQPKPSSRRLLPTASSATAVPLPAAILIYRDGRTEPVADYAIIGGILYARGDYWQQGYWSKPIQIATLDIPATILANQQRGVKFVLPSSPNEIITRP
jgi:hypothetical protein